MRRKFLIATISGVLAAGLTSSWGAELSVSPQMRPGEDSRRTVRVCGLDGCEWRRSYWHRCLGGRDARYTCGSLYGAYGPWGGAGYWDAYTAGY
jgi:hypothetical protein